MFYFSERVLNEIHDARLSSSTGTVNRGLGVRGLIFSHSRASAVSPGSSDQVEFGLKLARRSGRRISRDAWNVGGPGQVFDLIVHDLHVGIMPFLQFGRYGESSRTMGKVRAFWVYAEIQSIASGGSPLELIFVGSCDNLVNKIWNAEAEDRLKIGHSYPSGPGPVGRLLSWELQLENDESVRQDVADNEWWFGPPELGDEALFASQVTASAGRSPSGMRVMPHAGSAVAHSRELESSESLGMSGARLVILTCCLPGRSSLRR